MPKWTVQDSRELYAVPHWGRGLFEINDKGHLTVDLGDGGAIDLHEVICELEERGVESPILLRFPDILKKRVVSLATAFQTAIKAHGYTGRYRGVYPVKVNQQAQLVRDLVGFLRPFHMGLEAGSKPELLVVLALLDDPKALIICNGFKDEEFIETALLAQKLGRQPILVIEKLSEIELVLQVAERTGIRPLLGVRSKLAIQGRGHWAASSGDKAKFGLASWDILRLVERLTETGYLDCLKLLHFHIGSQITAIRSFKDAVREAGRTYTELVKLGAPMGFFDVGGGLGVDYDGSRTNFRASKNYEDREYASDVVYGIQTACEAAGVPEPDIVTETGRALVAHHAALIFNVLGVAQVPSEGDPVEVTEADPRQLQEMREVHDGVRARNVQEAWHDALSTREEGLAAYNLGLLDLSQRARLEKLYWQTCGRIRAYVRRLPMVPEELLDLERHLADTYFCNFSVFQSAPDSWAIDQLFPCMPIQRLDEQPKRRAVLADITCDSDGKLDTFIDLRDVKTTLELHTPNGAEYYLGLFLVGAYQEILGDLHNLFGDTNAVHVKLVGAGEWSIDHVFEGDTVRDVLGYVGYDGRELVQRVRQASERALKFGKITPREAKALLRAYRSGLDGYTYLERSDT
jgi:arginine decarboxylase